MATQIVDLLKFVLPEVSGCPSATAKLAIIDAAKEFLTFSGVWNEIQDPVVLEEGEPNYDLEAPTGARCINLKAVYAPWASRGELQGLTSDQLPVDWQTAEGNLPYAYTRAMDFSSIRVYPIPTNVDGTSAIRMHAIYTLKDTATSMPDDIVERYRDAICDGAKARLMVKPKQTWTDLATAAYYQAMFNDKKLVAKVHAEHSKTRGNITVPPLKFGFPG